ncbi:MAG TPA: peptidylprolyl isomerase [Actinomycetota bacterium]|nr:peptidylprolyl isomerase [Actinomycetota bacterium]
MMRRVWLASIAFILLAGCGGLLAPAAAVVNDKKITTEEIQTAVDDFKASQEFKRLAEQGDEDAITREFEQSYLSQLIRRAVLEPKATELGISVTEEDVEEQLDDIKAEFPSESAFNEALKEQGLTLEQLRQLVRDRALEEKLRAEVTAAAAPDEAELRAYYENNLDDFLETDTQHILVDERALATTISRQLRMAPKSEVDDLFDRLAKKHSKDKSNKAIGGALGYNPPGSFVPAFEEAADALEVGEISAPVKTRFGWHVIRVNDRRPRPFAQVEESIQVELGAPSDEEIWDGWVAEAYEAADVKVNPRYGEFNPETQTVEDVSARTAPGAQETPREAQQPSPTRSP